METLASILTNALSLLGIIWLLNLWEAKNTSTCDCDEAPRPSHPKIVWINFENVAIPENHVHHMEKSEDDKIVVVTFEGNKITTGSPWEDVEYHTE